MLIIFSSTKCCFKYLKPAMRKECIKKSNSEEEVERLEEEAKKK